MQFLMNNVDFLNTRISREINHSDSMAEEKNEIQHVEMSGNEEEKPTRKKCEVCGQLEWKYRCPCCSKLTCCLACIKQHKKDTLCTGQRDRTAFMQIRDMNEGTLLSDYMLMEEMNRVLDSSKRVTKDTFRSTVPKFLYYVQRAASKRSIQLQVMPYPYVKRVKNSTFFNLWQQTLFWHVEWNFVDADFKIEDERLSEDKTLGSLLAKYLDPVTSDPLGRFRLETYGTRSKKTLQEVLANCRLLLQDHAALGAKPCYFELKPSLKLSENLYGKTIQEYPTILVVKKDCGRDYPLSPECFPSQDLVASWKEQPKTQSERWGNENPKPATRRRRRGRKPYC